MAKGLLIDLAGVLYTGDQPIDGSVEALERLRDQGIPHLFITNTTRRTRQDLARHLQGMGFALEPERILTAVEATAAYLRAQSLRPYLLVHPAIREVFADLAGSPENAVVLGDAGAGFEYHALNQAFRLIMAGAPLVAMGDNRYFRDSDGELSLDIGPFKAALEHAAGVKAVVVGKPSPTFFTTACQQLGLEPGEVMMIGDDAESDVAAARRAGLEACLVRTGKYRPGDEARCPDAAVEDDFASAVARFLKAR